MLSAELPSPVTQEVDQRGNSGWVGCQWRNLEAEMRSTLLAQQSQQQRQQQQLQAQGGKVAAAAATATAVGPDGWRLRLRTPVQHLRELWGRRLQVGENGAAGAWGRGGFRLRIFFFVCLSPASAAGSM